MARDWPTERDRMRIGTRGSPLALAQAEETRARLAAAHGLATGAFEIVEIRTTGDRVQNRPLSEIGGKGLFTREIEEALLAGGIDIAVHSMKDMPVDQPEGLALTCYLPREDPRDAFITLDGRRLADLDEGAVVGTSSIRRRAQLLHRRPDLRVVEFRGNVQTRRRKLEDGVAEATFLAMAGLRRLGLSEIAHVPMEPVEMLPAVAQGAIGIEQRARDGRVRALLAAINDAETETRLAAERGFLAELDGSCQTPIAALATVRAGRVGLRGQILRPDGGAAEAGEAEAPAGEAGAMGAALARDLLAAAGRRYLGMT